MKHKSVRILITAGLVLILAAFVLTGYNILTDMNAASKAGAILEQMNFGETVQQEVSEGSGEAPEIEIDGTWCIGALEIPSLGIQLPVISQWDKAYARIAPCRYTGSPQGNDMIIAGHNYRSHFGKLRSISLGELVYFTDFSNRTFVYEAVAVETVDGTDIEGMKSGDWDLTLFTCTVGGQARVAVRCNRQ